MLRASTAVAGALALFAPAAALAQSASWVGATGNWNLTTNWSPAVVPTDTATFNGAGTQLLTITASTSIGTIFLAGGAPTYSYTINPGVSFGLTGTGILNSSANAPNFLNNGSTSFANSSTAANANFINNNTLSFNDTSTAGSASFISNAFLFFNNASTAGAATITNNGAMTFADTSSAGSANITNSGGGSLISFADNSTAGNATITTNAGALTQFTGNGNGGNAQLITNTGGTVNFNLSSGPSGNNQITVGSIAGAGTYNLGANQLTVGSNNLSTTVSGTIQDGGAGGSLVKVGTGTLTLSGTGDYTGSTTVNAGSLVVAAAGALPTTAVVVNAGANLTIADGVVADIGSLGGGGTVVVGPTDASTLLGIGISNPATTTFSGIFTGAGSLEFDGGNLTLTARGSRIGGDFEVCACDTDSVTISGGSFTVGGQTLVDGGTLAVSNGGSLVTNDLGVGSNMTISGAGSTVTVTGNTGIGVNGPGTLTISAGGVLDSQGPTEIDSIAGSGTPAVTVTGTGSRWNVSGPMTVGDGAFGGPGTLTIASGGRVDVTGPFMRIGDTPTGTSLVTVTGAGSVLNVSNELTLGHPCGCTIGTLTVADGGTVNVNGFFGIGAGSTLNLGIGALAGSFNTPAIDNEGLIVANFTNTSTLSAAIFGGGTLTKAGAGTLILTGTNTFTGGTTITAGTLQIGNGGLTGSIAGNITNNAALVFNRSGALTYGGVISGTGTVTQAGSGILNLSGTSLYTGATAVNAGTLWVTGNISSSSGVTVNSGGTLGGDGVVSDVTVDGGGTLAPGLQPAIGTLTSTGNLTFNAGAFYSVQVTPVGTNSQTSVSGSATINGGTVIVRPLIGHYNPTTYTIINATGGRTGTFSSLAFGGPFGFTGSASLRYDPTNVFLDLGDGYVVLAPTRPLNPNQQNVVNAINNFITSGGALPPGFLNLFNLSPALLGQALTQLSGENSVSGGQSASFQVMNQFLLLMLNPFDSGRGGGFGGGGFGAGEVNRFAPERQLPPEIARAYAAVTPSSERTLPFAARWNVWASAYGGTNQTSGNADAGTNSFSTRTGGIAAGLDYKLSPDTLIGFALASGNATWNLAQGLGGGNSNVFQAGLYGSHRSGPWYISGAAAFANYWTSTSRTITVPAVDTLNAGFIAQSFGGRLEAGYKIAWAPVNIAPYVAYQVQTFSTPSYSEIATSGSNQFALSFASRTGNVQRGEIGSWLSKDYLLAGQALATVFGRAAWAHDWQNAPQASATFLGLAPVASFVVGGSQPSPDLAVVTAGAEIRMASGWALMGKFDGEFGNGTQSYVGTGRVRYAW